MRDSSDTEPDSDQESCMVAPRTSPPTSEPYPSATDNEAGDDDHRQSVTKAVEDIQRIELSQIAQVRDQSTLISTFEKFTSYT